MWRNVVFFQLLNLRYVILCAEGNNGATLTSVFRDLDYTLITAF